jgi:hypothetical protein
MIIEGEWHRFPDGITRPIIRAGVVKADGAPYPTVFLVDSGADRTVFCRETFDALGLPALSEAPPGALAGIGGQVGCVLVQTALLLVRNDGTPIRIQGPFAAFLAPDANDMDLLGRDVLNNFDVILSYPRRQVLLLAPNHAYQVVSP